MLQFLTWFGERPRTYGETMESWRTCCPRFSIWGDAVMLTDAGRAALDGAR